MVKEIKNKKEYEVILSRIYDHMQKDLKKDSDELKELDLLAREVEKYEEKNYKIRLDN